MSKQYSLKPTATPFENILASLQIDAKNFEQWLKKFNGMDIRSFSETLFGKTVGVPLMERGAHKESNQERLKILEVSGMFPSIHHGGGLRAFDILQTLKKKHDVYLHYLSSESDDDRSKKMLFPSLMGISENSEKEFTFENLNLNLGKKSLAFESFDAIHIDYWHALDWIPRLQARHSRIVFTMMENLTRALFILIKNAIETGASVNEHILNSYFMASQVEVRALKIADAVIAVTDADAEFAQFIMDRPVAVVPTGVSEETVLDYTPKRSEDSDVKLTHPTSAVFVGSYNHQPNVDGMQWYFSKIHGEVLKKLPSYRVRVVGQGNLESLKKEFGYFQESVDWIGPVVNISDAILESKIGIAPLINGAGIRGKVNQYIACWRPVVGTSIALDGMPYTSEEVRKCDQPEAFAKEIVGLLSNVSEWEKLRVNSYQTLSQHYFMGPICEKVVRIFRGENDE